MGLAHAITSLNRISAATREGHLTHITKVIEYLNRRLKQWIVINPVEHHPQGDVAKPYSTKDETVEGRISRGL
jgi:hypothetical protein